MTEREEILEEIRSCLDAYLESPDLSPAWIAGWHAAVNHVAYVVRSNNSVRVEHHPIEVTRDARVAAQAIRDCAAAMPVYGRRDEPAEFDGEDVREYMREYARSLETVSTASRRPSD